MTSMLIEPKTRITRSLPPRHPRGGGGPGATGPYLGLDSRFRGNDDTLSAQTAASPGDSMPPAKRGQLMLDDIKLARFVDQCWGDAIVPTLVDYIKIPNKSPAFDPDWAAHGHMEEAVRLFERWARERIAGLPGATLEVVRLPGRTPLILIEVPASGPAA